MIRHAHAELIMICFRLYLRPGTGRVLSKDHPQFQYEIDFNREMRRFIPREVYRDNPAPDKPDEGDDHNEWGETYRFHLWDTWQ